MLRVSSPNKNHYLKLSIIIVNYNVKYFLEHCLCSVKKAIEPIIAEVFVVDNASTDKSYEYLNFKFPFVKWILNTTNKGFSAANNQALEKATGDYVLFLNPDTIVPEDCFLKCIHHFENNITIGALGIKMLDGSGNFLPESKRSFPTPTVSFFKLTGLSSLFPKSKLFGKYHLGNLDKNENHEVDVLAGAFLMVQKEIIKKLKGFDETFFMYGEDIDLSYRIQQLGFKNIYFSESSIIHFKGESTKKGSLNYVKMFYHAMNIFVTKHYSGTKAKMFSVFIKTAIWVRAFISAIFQFINKIGLPVLDTLIIIASFYLVKNIWVNNIREGLEFVPQIVNTALPIFSILFLITSWMAGMYDKTFKLQNAVYAALFSIVVLLAFYSLLPENIRFSRGVILFGGITALIFILFFRWILIKANFLELSDDYKEKQVQAIVGSEEEYNQVVNIFKSAGYGNISPLRISANEYDVNENVGTVFNLKEHIKTFRIRELIFCEGQLTFKKIILTIKSINSKIRIRFYSKESQSIIGSDSKNTAGNSLNIYSHYALAKPYYLRIKKIVDIFFSVLMLILFPVFILLNKIQFIKESWLVIMGRKTWIGYNLPENNLPNLPESIFSNINHLRTSNKLFNVDTLKKMDVVYAANYVWAQDVKLIIINLISSFKKL